MSRTDFKNKDPTKKPCIFCRDVLIYWRSYGSHSYTNCYYNENGEFGCNKYVKTKKTKETIEKVVLQRKQFREI